MTDLQVDLGPPGRVWAALVVLAEELSSDDLIAEVGMAPDQSWSRGDRVGRTGRGRRPLTGWRLDTSPSTASADVHVSALLDRVRDVQSRLEALGEDPRIHSISLWVWSHGPTFVLDLRPSRITEIARLNASLKVDIYDVDDEGRHGSNGR